MQLALAVVLGATAACALAEQPTMTSSRSSAIWILRNDDRLARVDAATLRVMSTLDLGPGLWAVAAGDDAVWAVGQGNIYRVDPAANRVVATIPTGGFPHAVGVSAGAVWVAVSPTSSLASRGSAPTDARVVRIDPATNRLVATIPIPASHLDQLAVGEGAVWVTAMDVTPGAPDDPRVARIDPAANAVAATIDLSVFPLDLAAGEGAVWLTTDQSSAGKVLVWLDPQTNQEAGRIELDDVSDSVAVGEGAVWVTSKYSKALFRVDPAAKKMAAAIPLLIISLDVAVGDGAVWVTGYDGDLRRLVRVDAAANRVVGDTEFDQAWKVAVGE